MLAGPRLRIASAQLAVALAEAAHPRSLSRAPPTLFELRRGLAVALATAELRAALVPRAPQRRSNILCALSRRSPDAQNARSARRRLFSRRSRLRPSWRPPARSRLKPRRPRGRTDADGTSGDRRRRASRRRRTGVPTRARGPFKTLVIRGVMLIDGTGAPPAGSGRRRRVRQPHRLRAQRRHARPAAAQPNRAPQAADLELDATGMYLMPGFVDMHVHAGGAPKNADAEYAYKLWLAHGVTTVRGVPLGSNSITVSDKPAQREERDRRAAHLQLPAAGQWLGQGRHRHRPSWRASTCAGRPPTASMASSSAPSVRRSWRHCSTRRRRSASDRPRTCSRAASRR